MGSDIRRVVQGGRRRKVVSWSGFDASTRGQETLGVIASRSSIFPSHLLVLVVTLRHASNVLPVT